MISWQDEGAILAARPHGENAMIIETLTETHGRHAGVVRGGASRKMAATLQPGTQVALTWKARIDDHLGAFTVEPLRGRTAQTFDNRLALSGLGAVTALLTLTLPEREAHPALYARTIRLLDLLGQDDLWPLAYLQWEMALLEELGFGLDLSACAVHGTNEDLAFISPKSGRAVSREAAGDWAPRLLPLVPVMVGKGEATGDAIATALTTTGYFLEHRLLASSSGKPLPAARDRLLALIAQTA